jgi:transcriptional regulator with XRE-family HTH domain
MSNLRVQFGRNLRVLRQQRQLTQEQLASAIDVSVESISNIERGIYAPNFNNLEKLAEVLEVPIATLFLFGE